MENYRITASINSFVIKTEVKPYLTDLAKPWLISCKKTQQTGAWMTWINQNEIRYHEEYSGVVADFSDYIRDLKISECSFYSTRLKIDIHTWDLKQSEVMNTLLIKLFGIALNKEVKCENWSRTDIQYSEVANDYWGMLYRCSWSEYKSCLYLMSIKPTRKSGRKPHELKQLWFKKLDQLPVIYEYLKIMRSKEEEKYSKVKELLKAVSLSELTTYINDIKLAMDRYFNS